MTTWLDGILRDGVLPIVRTPDASSAHSVMVAVLKAGASTVEVSLGAPGALDAVRRLTAGQLTHPVGVGTVLSVEDVHAAADAGAAYIVTPTTNAQVITHAQERGLGTAIGSATPTEIMLAAERGADAIKIFPARQLGGIAYLRSIRQVFPDLVLVPTGGVGSADIGAYRGAGASAVGVGGALAAKESVEGGNWTAVRTNVRQLLEAWQVAGE